MRGDSWKVWRRSVLALLLSAAAQARAADPKEWGDESAADDENQPKPAPPAAPATDAKEAEAKPAEEAKPEPTAPVDATPLAEQNSGDGSSDYLLGLRYRGVFLPAGVLHWFIEGGESIYVNGVGPELAIEDGNFEYVLSAWLALYTMNPVAIKGTKDAEEAWEIVDSNMKSLYLTFDYLWHHPVSRNLDLSYGGGAGLGFMFGDLHRTQATLKSDGKRGNPNDYIKCDGINQPLQGGYCDDINNHYNGYGEPNWFHGGAKPALFPWVTGQVGLRYQPHPKFVARLDLGLGTSGVYFGVGADYGL
jgi:hypothetical protein